MNGAGVNDGFVADGDQFPNDCGEVVGEMDDGAVLNVAARADQNAVDVAAQDRLIPDTAVVTQRYIPQHIRTGSDKNPGAELGPTL